MENFLLMLFLGFVVLLVILDIGMVVSLALPGDERKQMIVWRASTYTLLAWAGATIGKIAEKLISMEPLAENPFVSLGTTAIIYFVLLLYFKRKYGG